MIRGREGKRERSGRWKEKSEEKVESQIRSIETTFAHIPPLSSEDFLSSTPQASPQISADKIT